MKLAPDEEWLNSLPTITDQVAERPIDPPKRRRFISEKFSEQIKRKEMLDDAEQRLTELDRELRHLEQVKIEAKRRAAQLKQIQQLNGIDLDSDEGVNDDADDDGDLDEPLWS